MTGPGGGAFARCRVGVLLTGEPDHVAVVPVQSLASGQAPGPAHRQPARAADPEPGRLLPAVDAQLDGVQLFPRRCGRVPWCSSAVTAVRAGAGNGECSLRQAGSGRGVTAAAGTAARWVSRAPARLVRDRPMRATWFMVTSCRAGPDAAHGVCVLKPVAPSGGSLRLLFVTLSCRFGVLPERICCFSRRGCRNIGAPHASADGHAPQAGRRGVAREGLARPAGQALVGILLTGAG